MNKLNLLSLLRRYNVCPKAVIWAKGKTARQAWNECHHGAWLLWIVARVGVDRRLIVAAAAGCAELAFEYIKDDVALLRAMLAVHVAREFVAGRADDGDCRAAAGAAATHADSATYAAAQAAFVVDDDAYAADSAIYAANAAYAAQGGAFIDAATHAAATAANADMQRQCADAVRANIKFEDVHAAALASLSLS